MSLTTRWNEQTQQSHIFTVILHPTSRGFNQSLLDAFNLVEKFCRKQVWVQSRQLGCQHDMQSPHLLLNAVLQCRCCWVTVLAAVERYVPPAGRSAANPPHDAAAVERWDRQTDRRTPDRYTNPVLHTMRAKSISRQTMRYWRTVPESIHGRQLSNEMTVDESSSLSWQSKMQKQTKHVIDHRRPHNQSLI